MEQITIEKEEYSFAVSTGSIYCLCSDEWEGKVEVMEISNTNDCCGMPLALVMNADGDVFGTCQSTLVKVEHALQGWGTA